MEKNSPLKFLGPMALAAAPGVLKGVAGLAGGLIGSKKRRREQRAAQREYDSYKTQLENRDTSNPYQNMENVYEDLTVNTQAADFAASQQAQGMANTMDAMQGAAGGSGIAALAQAMAGQQNQAAQQASIDIGRQEQANQQAALGEAGAIQQQERQGDIMSRQQQNAKTNMLMGMSQGRLGAANAAMDQQRAAIAGGIGGIAGSVGGAIK
ncbi:MAG: hypothetical protein CBD16_03640 [Betaproteobacteria bacterium TMED156]|nr:MAG: hypothetical protein CBD16_03640 [Betaproteobacteria bacterium TMED156]